MQIKPFSKYVLNNIDFNEVVNSVKFENIAKGRKGAVIVSPNKNNLIPIVRTTTMYNEPAQIMKPIHYNIINNIKEIVGVPNLELNNALVELYDCSYRNMGFHTDQSLDLNDDSYICVFSCYKNGNDLINQRVLEVKNKETNNIEKITLSHNSVIIFSTKDNHEHLHRIFLDNYNDTNNNLWFGITFRLSKRLIKYTKLFVYFDDNTILKLASDKEKEEFIKCKSIENKIINYKYKNINYTISFSDLLPPDNL